jgi:hypothetical protein
VSLNSEIEELRNQINILDAEIIGKIAELVKTSKRIRNHRESQTFIDPDDLFNELILDDIDNLANKYSLNLQGIERFFTAFKDLLSKTGRENL